MTDEAALGPVMATAAQLEARDEEDRASVRSAKVGATLPEEVVFERQVACVIETVSKAFLYDTKLERSDLVNFVAGQLTYRLEKLIYAHRLGRLEVEYPATPWEHFRDAHFPKTRLGRWFLKRKPVRKTAVVKSAFAAFPEAHVAWPDPPLGRPTIILRDDI